MAVNNQLTLLLVTYHDDFDMLDGLFTSIVNHSLNEYKLLIVLNDSTDYLNELKSIINEFQIDYEIVEKFSELEHTPVFHSNFGVRQTDIGWITQQMITLLAAKIIKTPYYLHVCSKDIFAKSFKLSDIISTNKVKVQQEEWYFIRPDVDNLFNNYFKNVCKLFKLDQSLARDKMIKCMTPVVNNTEYINRMLDDIRAMGLELADIIGIDKSSSNTQNKTNEYYLYCAWLAKNNLTDQVLEFYKSSASPYNMREKTYDLRRK